MRPYKIHHRKISLTNYTEAQIMQVFREEEDQGYYLQAIVPFTAIDMIGVFRLDMPNDELELDTPDMEEI